MPSHIPLAAASLSRPAAMAHPFLNAVTGKEMQAYPDIPAPFQHSHSHPASKTVATGSGTIGFNCGTP